MTNEPSEPQDEESDETIVNDDPTDLPAGDDVTEAVEVTANDETDELGSTDATDVYDAVVDDVVDSDDIAVDIDNADLADPDSVLGESVTGDEPVNDYTTGESVADDEPVNDYTTGDDDADDEPVNDTGGSETGSDTFGATQGAAGFPGTAVPTAQYVPLLRDSSGVLGGVASGFGKRYGLDVSLVRLGIVALAFSGFGILAYFAAWIIIPKSAVPLVASPPHPDQTRKALGAVLVGAAVIFGLSALGSSGAVLVPLTLLGAGIWLLMQPPAPAVGYHQTQTQPSGAVPSATVPPQQTYSTPAGAYGSTQANYAAPAPVQKRKSRTGLKIFGGLMAFMALILLAGIAIIGAVVASEPDVYFEADSDNFQVDFGNETVDRVIRPTSMEDIPEGAFDTQGTLTLDLTDVEVTAADLDELPFESEFGVGNGALEVIVPEGLDVRFETNVDSGTIEYLNEVYSGENISRDFGPSDPDLILDLNVDDGIIIIVEN